MSRYHLQPLAGSHRAVALTLALFGVSTPVSAAHAEVHVEGNPAAVHITTSRDSIRDVLSALGTAFNVQHRSAIALDAAANPTYAGPIERVIANLLDGFNYIVRKSGGETEIIVLGRAGEVAIPPSAPKPQPAGLLSRWR